MNINNKLMKRERSVLRNVVSTLNRGIASATKGHVPGVVASAMVRTEYVAGQADRVLNETCENTRVQLEKVREKYAR